MDNYQKVEQLVNKAGCSFEEAKAALEGCEWDMLDAVISLEREGKVKKETAEFKAEEPIEIIPEVSADKISGNSSQQITYSYADDNAGNQGSKESKGGSKESPKRARRFFQRIKSILMNNRMVVIKSNGKQIADLPIVIPVIALIAFFWATLIVAVAAMVFGCHFHFEGEDLGKTNINNTMDKATDYAEKVKNDLAGKVNGGQNTDNRR